MAGGTTPGDLAGCYDGLIDALVIDESDAPAVARVELVVTKTLMYDRESASRARENGAGGGVRIAIVGGTGPFGTALAKRLKGSGYTIVLGSRDIARAAVAAAELGVEGATNEDAVRAADLVVLATNADAALDTARLLRDAIGSRPLLCVASELRFTPSGVLPSPEATSLAERIQDELDAPVVAGLHPRRLDPRLGRASRRGRFRVRRRRGCEAPRSRRSRSADRRSRLRCRTAGSARALEGMIAVAVNLNKRYRGHAGIRVTGLP